MVDPVGTAPLSPCGELTGRCRAMVAVLFTMCALQVCFTVYTLWLFSVQSFGNYAALMIQSWATTTALGILMAL